MSQPDDPRTAVQVALGLTRSVDGLGAKVRTLIEEIIPRLDAYGKRNRTLIRRGYFFLAIDIILTITATVAVAVAVHADHRAAAADASAAAAKVSAAVAAKVAAVAQQNNRNLCLSGNESRAQQHGLWLYLISLSPPKTAQAKKLIGKFENHLDVIYAPRNCAHVNPRKP